MSWNFLKRETVEMYKKHGGLFEDEVLEKMMIQDVNIKDKEKLEVQEAKALVKEKCKAAMVKSHQQWT